MNKDQKEYEQIMKSENSELAIPYAMDVSLKIGDLISHTKFGIGKVIECITPNKVSVHFSDQKRILICQLHKEEEDI